MSIRSVVFGTSVLAICMLSVISHAAIIINGTRVIYPSDEKEITVQVRNEGVKPALMQTWIDNGNADITPDKSIVPFIITPPVSRVDAKTGQSIRIAFTRADLPKDRESVFWLNVLDIPAKPETTKEKSAPENFLQIAIRNRIKLFYRPANINGKALDVPKKLQWKVANRQLLCTNPTPYYVSFSSIQTISTSGTTQEVAPEGYMLAPFENHTFELQDHQVAKVQFTNINDYGGIDESEFKLLSP